MKDNERKNRRNTFSIQPAATDRVNVHVSIFIFCLFFFSVVFIHFYSLILPGLVADTACQQCDWICTVHTGLGQHNMWFCCISCDSTWTNESGVFSLVIRQWTISLFELVFCSDQRQRPNRSILVSVQSWD